METVNGGTNKIERVLGIYTKLVKGFIVNKVEEADKYGVTERSIQRDIEDIRNFMEQSLVDSGAGDTVVYDWSEKGYRLEHIGEDKFSNGEVLAICKILLDSRAFTKSEMAGMIEKILTCCVPEKNQMLVRELISNEMFHYIEPRHKTVFIDKMWEIGQAIQGHSYIEIKYMRLKDKKYVIRKVEPVAILFSEFYFYMAAFIEDEKTKADFDVMDDSYPTIYRIDRIKKLKVLDEKYNIPYKNRFEEGEFRKRIQFMYGGKLRKIKFEYSGLSVEAVLDRLPTAKILSERDGVYTISAEVFGDGIDMWLRSQGEIVKVI